MNMKIVAAPILAIALALFLAGAISYLPVTPTSNDIEGLQATGGFTTTEGTPAPMPAAAPSMAVVFSPILFIPGAIIIGILAIVLLFREKA